MCKKVSKMKEKGDNGRGMMSAASLEGANLNQKENPKPESQDLHLQILRQKKL